MPDISSHQNFTTLCLTLWKAFSKFKKSRYRLILAMYTSIAIYFYKKSLLCIGVFVLDNSLRGAPIMSLTVPKFPHSSLFLFKSHGVKSEEYGGWFNTHTWFPTKSWDKIKQSMMCDLGHYCVIIWSQNYLSGPCILLKL